MKPGPKSNIVGDINFQDILNGFPPRRSQSYGQHQHHVPGPKSGHMMKSLQPGPALQQTNGSMALDLQKFVSRWMGLAGWGSQKCNMDNMEPRHVQHGFSDFPRLSFFWVFLCFFRLRWVLPVTQIWGCV